MKKGLFWIILLIIIVVLIAVFNRNKGTDETSSIKIGFVGPLTGDAASLGEIALQTAQMAIEEVNAEGGINGRMIELIAEDGQCSGDTASSAVNKLISINGVSAIIGGLCSAESSAIISLIDSGEIPTISYGSSAPALSNVGEYFFRNYPSDSYESVFAAEYIKNTLGKENVAILYTQDEWGVGLQEAFETAFTENGGNVLTKESFTKTSRDIRSQIAKIQTTKPDLVYFLGFNEASVPGIRQFKEANFDVQLFGSTAWTDLTIWNSLGDLANGTMYAELDAGVSDEFKNKAQAFGIAEITLGSTQSYDAVKIFVEAFKEVGTEGSKVKDYLYNNKFEGTITYPITDFDENGDVVGAQFRVNKIEGGKPIQIN